LDPNSNCRGDLFVDPDADIQAEKSVAFMTVRLWETGANEPENKGAPHLDADLTGPFLLKLRAETSFPKFPE